MIEILTKIGAKITVIVIENREPYCFINIYKYKEVPLSLFSYQMLVSTFDSDERSSYYMVFDIFLSSNNFFAESNIFPENGEKKF